MNNNRIKTGYDLEINLGSDFFKNIIDAAYDSGKIPKEMEFGNDKKLEIKKPTEVDIVTGKGRKGDLEVEFEVWYSGMKFPVIMTLELEIKKDEILLKYVCLDKTTQGLINWVGSIDDVNKKLTNAVNQKIDLKMISKTVVEFEKTKVKGGHGYQDAIVLLINLNLKINSQNKYPETSYIDRGNKDKAESILPKGKSFFVGVSKETFNRIANSAYHDTGEKYSFKEPYTGTMVEGIAHPLKDGKKTVGHIKSISIKPKNGYIEFKLKAEYYIDWWPDADITIVFKITPKIENKKLSIDMELSDLDIDTGILGDILGFLAGTGLGFLFFGPLGAAIGGVGGIATIEITESSFENKFEDDIEDTIKKDANIFSIFSSLPLKSRIFTDERDIFFNKEFYLVNQFTELKCDTRGFSFGGKTLIENKNIPEQMIDIIDKKNGYSNESKFGLESLTYTVKNSNKKYVLTLKEILKRLSKKEIDTVLVKPEYIHREKTIVSHVKFKYGLELTIQEVVNLHKNKIIHVWGYQFIEPKSGNSYFRAQKDESLENNFESLPIFKPKKD